MVKNLTRQQIESIQIDEGVVFLNYGETDARLLGPTRGGGEVSIKTTLRNIEHDGARGAEKGLQVVESQEATVKVTVLDMGQDNTFLAIPGAVKGADDSITSGEAGVIPEDKYLKNITVFTKTLGGKYKRIQVNNAMHEGDFVNKAAPKSEGEMALEFVGHFDPLNAAEPLYSISETAEAPVLPGAQEG